MRIMTIFAAALLLAACQTTHAPLDSSFGTAVTSNTSAMVNQSAPTATGSIDLDGEKAVKDMAKYENGEQRKKASIVRNRSSRLR